jgi:hypothetical protein
MAVRTGTETRIWNAYAPHHACGGPVSCTWADGGGRRMDTWVASRQWDRVDLEEQNGNDLPRGLLCWGTGVSACEGEGEPEDLVFRGGTRACWVLREAEGPCRGP